jgi:Fic family protein
MIPPYEITTEVFKLGLRIRELITKVEGYAIPKPEIKLRKENKIKSIIGSLEIEGNSLGEELITALVDGHRVVGSEREVSEVLNAIKAYDSIKAFTYHSPVSFKKMHGVLMENLIDSAGRYRSGGVAVVDGKKVIHMAPPASNVHYLINNLFQYLENAEDDLLIKSCVAHYEIEFIHPFADGNGRMGRIWQSLILIADHPIFQFVPFEMVIKENQKEYYKVLAACDKVGKSTQFIVFMFNCLIESLEQLYLDIQNQGVPEVKERVKTYLTMYDRTEAFSRKNYMEVWKDISSATASRDLKYAVEKEWLKKIGDKRKAAYIIREENLPKEEN